MQFGMDITYTHIFNYSPHPSKYTRHLYSNKEDLLYTIMLTTAVSIAKLLCIYIESSTLFIQQREETYGACQVEV